MHSCRPEPISHQTATCTWRLSRHGLFRPARQRDMSGFQTSACPGAVRARRGPRDHSNPLGLGPGRVFKEEVVDVYVLLVLAELLIGQIGFAITAAIDPLAAGLVMALTGAPALAIYAIGKTGPLRFESLNPQMRRITYRLAAGNLVMNVVYVVGIHFIGLGVITTMTALGPLCTGAKGFWEGRRTRNGALHIILRATALVGVFVVNQAWREIAHFNAGMAIGFACGIVGAWSFWNYNQIFFGDKIPKEERIRLVATADVLSLPPLALAVWGASLILGGGYAALSARVLMLGAIAGIFGFLIPTILTGYAAIKTPEGKGAEKVTSMVYLLDSPIASLVGLIGADLGLLAAKQAPNAWNWLGTGVVVLAAFFAAKLPFPMDPSTSMGGKASPDISTKCDENGPR